MGNSLTVEGASRGGGVVRSTPRADTGDLDALRAEVDQYYAQVRDLGNQESSEIFMSLAAITSRLSEMRKDVYRVPSRAYSAFRTQEIDPLLDECDRQFRFFSRAFATMELDAKLSTGGGVM